MQTELTEAMREESWSNWEKARAGIAEISRIMEKLDKEIEGMGIGIVTGKQIGRAHV